LAWPNLLAKKRERKEYTRRACRFSRTECQPTKVLCYVPRTCWSAAAAGTAPSVKRLTRQTNFEKSEAHPLGDRQQRRFVKQQLKKANDRRASNLVKVRE